MLWIFEPAPIPRPLAPKTGEDHLHLLRAQRFLFVGVSQVNRIHHSLEMPIEKPPHGSAGEGAGSGAEARYMPTVAE